MASEIVSEKLKINIAFHWIVKYYPT